jgi:hypothetical protein
MEMLGMDVGRKIVNAKKKKIDTFRDALKYVCREVRECKY